ncbi:hypothetical protein [Rhizobium sp. YTU87027]|uniref:hypothetical protein n=1 Tax=Rhizobium sp. YTU87027 TaxID=3417741 RepID=UPI003D6849F0
MLPDFPRGPVTLRWRLVAGAIVDVVLFGSIVFQQPRQKQKPPRAAVPPLLVSIVGRNSTDQQNPTLIGTQLDLGKESHRAARWHLANTFVDADVSGSSFETRPGRQAALHVVQEVPSLRIIDDTFDKKLRGGKQTGARADAEQSSVSGVFRGYGMITC